MKTTILKISAIFLLFSLMGAGCEKDDSYEEISLEYKKCPCEHEATFLYNIEIQSILLFDENRTSLDEMKSLSFDGEKSQFISYSKENSTAKMHTVRVGNIGKCNICNFPFLLIDWEIASTGELFALKAEVLEECETTGSTANNIYSDCILTTFKKMKK